ncbi:MAG TPA: tat (twin-arginine translocation) pathway signal sequence [Elusimicrobia bacterium]|nr:tat (twin-arginine translocation) pathway signal sequence [Elusimicrobiota bacterium]HBT61413.1 tat (twin-arginine translocation) pathway signal sequence [Elusimicrobiota bacterium]
MTRQGFIKLGFSVVAGGLLPPLLRKPLLGKTKDVAANASPDLVAVKEGSPVQMFDAGIKALGGLGRFVRKGQIVLVKPNIGWDKTPSEGADTNPELVGRVVAAAYEVGARKVYCFDHPVNVEADCYRRSGIEKAVKDHGGEMRAGSDQGMYRKVAIQGASVLKEALVHELYLDCDVVINVPVLKSHGGGRMTASLKNLMGVVWDRRFWHRTDLQRCIAEFPLLRKPDLNVVDAYLVMMEHGPYGASTEDLALKKMQILSADPVLADTAAAKVLERSPETVPYLRMASDLGVGSMDLARAAIKRISLKA